MFSLSFQEEENGELDSSEIQEENPVFESIAEANYSREPGRTRSGTEAAGCDENNANIKETPCEIITTKDGEQKVCGDSRHIGSTIAVSGLKKDNVIVDRVIWSHFLEIV